MKKLYFFLLFFAMFTVNAQQIDGLFCINYKHLPNPNGPSTNGIIHVSEILPQQGFVSNIGPSLNVVAGDFTASGGASNQINNTLA